MFIKRTSFFLVLAAVSISSATRADEFLKALGTITLGERHITISASNVVDGLVPTISITDGHHEDSETITSWHWKSKAWFAYVEEQANVTKVWLFDGKDQLRVILRSQKIWDDSDDSKDLAECPAQVRKALPLEVREDYFGHGS